MFGRSRPSARTNCPFLHQAPQRKRSGRPEITNPMFVVNGQRFACLANDVLRTAGQIHQLPPVRRRLAVLTRPSPLHGERAQALNPDGPVGTFGQLNRPLVRVAGFEGKPVVGVKPSQAARLVSSRSRIRPRTHEIKESCRERRQRQQIPAVMFENSY